MIESVTRRVRTAILISGTGTNMQALVEAAKADEYPAEIVLVLSNRPLAKGLRLAEEAGIPVATVDHKAFASRETFEAAVDETLRRHGVELVALAGFMRILTPGFVDGWTGRMVNIHPSLLPKYKGLDTHARAIAAGDALHGTSVHWVTPELDGGDVIAQSRFAIPNGADVSTLTELVKSHEHALYPKALAKAAEAVRQLTLR